jgi:hypothetical protein
MQRKVVIRAFLGMYPELWYPCDAGAAASTEPGGAKPRTYTST